MPESVHIEKSKTEPESDVAGSLTRALDGWRSRIDEVLVQFDLAGLDARDEVRKQVNLVENVYLAARSRLSTVHDDASSSASSVCADTEKLIRDLKQAFEAAQAAFHRTRAE